MKKIKNYLKRKENKTGTWRWQVRVKEWKKKIWVETEGEEWVGCVEDYLVYGAPAVLCCDVSLVPQKGKMIIWIIDNNTYTQSMFIFVLVCCVTTFPFLKWLKTTTTKNRSWQWGEWRLMLWERQHMDIQRRFLWKHSVTSHWCTYSHLWR